MTKPITKLLTLQAVTFLHPGTGQTTGVVDLPVQREVHTKFPMFSASGLKGSLRDKAEHMDGIEDSDVLDTFGASAGDNPSAGALAVTDARILAFPVRSLQTVFVWVTCPMVLNRMKRDIGLAQLDIDIPAFDFSNIGGDNALVHKESPLNNTTLVLEEMIYEAVGHDAVKPLADFFTKILNPDSGFAPERLAVIPNRDFQYFVTYATQVSTRIQLNEQKTTTGGGGNMWVEETLPPETILYAMAVCHAPRNNEDETGPEKVAGILDKLDDDGYLQIGGNETVGQGWCCFKVKGGAP